VKHRVPIVATILVLGAASTMAALGVWQLGRMAEKEALLDRYEAAGAMSSEVAWPSGDGAASELLFRRSSLDCTKVISFDARAGTSARGAKGWAHHANCTIEGNDAVADVALGWSRSSESPQWDGGSVSGVIAPGPRLVVMTPIAGLEQLAPPDPADVPNNHLAYAGQWFFFAITALVIYGLAIRKRMKEAA